MATTTSITTTYAGEFAGKYISAALLSGNTIANGGLTVRPNVKFKEVVKRMELDGIVKDGTCDFADTSTLTLTERILQPEEFQVNLELCKKDFRSDWEAIQMGYSAFDNLPKTFQDYLIMHVAAKVAQKTENTVWKGVNANPGEFDGFEVLLAADADLPAAQEVAGTTATAANVIDEFTSFAFAIEPASISLVIPAAFTLSVSALISIELLSTLTSKVTPVRDKPSPAVYAPDPEN